MHDRVATAAWVVDDSKRPLVDRNVRALFGPSRHADGGNP
jgi:hypothetical protein